MYPRKVRVTVASTSSSTAKAESDLSVEHVTEFMLDDESRVRHFIELFQKYCTKRGSEIQSLAAKFGTIGFVSTWCCKYGITEIKK